MLAGYERHVRNVHTSKSTIAQISDHAIADILKTALSELGSDLCYPITIRSKWMACQITQNEDLNVKVTEIWKISRYIKCRMLLRTVLLTIAYLANVFSGIRVSVE